MECPRPGWLPCIIPVGQEVKREPKGSLPCQFGFLSCLLIRSFLKRPKFRLKTITKAFEKQKLASTCVNFVQPCAGNLGLSQSRFGPAIAPAAAMYRAQQEAAVCWGLEGFGGPSDHQASKVKLFFLATCAASTYYQLGFLSSRVHS